MADLIVKPKVIVSEDVLDGFFWVFDPQKFKQWVHEFTLTHELVFDAPELVDGEYHITARWVRNTVEIDTQEEAER